MGEGTMDLRRAGTLLLMAALEMPATQAWLLASELMAGGTGTQTPLAEASKAPPRRTDGAARARLAAMRQVVDLFAGGAEPFPLGLSVVTGRCGAYIGHGARSESTGALYPGEVVRVWHVAGGWSFVSEVDGGRPVAGWVLSEYLRAADGEEA
jgi:hypothetical protein